jgi:hypothetical protein
MSIVAVSAIEMPVILAKKEGMGPAVARAQNWRIDCNFANLASSSQTTPHTSSSRAKKAALCQNRTSDLIIALWVILVIRFTTKPRGRISNSVELVWC